MVREGLERVGGGVTMSDSAEAIARASHAVRRGLYDWTRQRLRGERERDEGRDRTDHI
jgi:hypothetical protein